MKRLLKNAFIGNINKDDLDFTLDEETLECYVKNKEKVINKSLAGFITYDIDHEEKELYVNLIKVSRDYKDTRVAMHMFKYFEENVINYLIDSYGDQLVIGADFLNHDLADLVERYCKKRGIQFKNYNDHPSRDLYNDEHIEYLKSKGIEAEKKGGTIIIRNADFDLVASAMDEIDYKTNNSGMVFSGVICDNGDIEYTVFNAIPPENGIQFKNNQRSKFVSIMSEYEDFILAMKRVSNLSNFELIFQNYKFSTYNVEAKSYQEIINEVRD